MEEAKAAEYRHLFEASNGPYMSQSAPDITVMATEELSTWRAKPSAFCVTGGQVSTVLCSEHPEGSPHLAFASMIALKAAPPLCS